MKRILTTVLAALALPVMADWTMVVNQEATPNQIILFDDLPIGSVGTKFTVTTYSNQLDAITAAQTAVAGGATYDTNSIAIPASPSQQYVYENVFLMICDALTGQTSHAKLPMEQLSMILLQVKAVDKPKYENIRDALQMLNAALTRENVKWWDTCTWHSEPPAAAGAQQLMSLMQ